MKKTREVYNCKEGEMNTVTTEIFCLKFRDFCKYINDCGIKNIKRLNNDRSTNNR